MWFLISVVLLIVSCIKGNVDMLQASGIFAVAAAVEELTRRK